MKLSSFLMGSATTCILSILLSGNAYAQLDEIVVTATKREQSLQDVAVAVSAFSAEKLEQTGIVSAQTLDLVTPGLTMSESVFVPQPVLRGISTSNRNPGDEASVPTFIDGMVQPWQYAAFFEYNNIERVEVLRGPQGTLFGRNATGGAINIVTKRPQYETSGEIGLSYDTLEKKKAVGYFTTGLSENVAMDVAAFWIDGGGYYEDLSTGDDIGNHDNTFSIRSKLLFEPSDSTDVTLMYNYTDFDNDLGFVGQPLNGNSITAAPAAGAGLLPTRPFEAAQNESRLSQKQHNAGLTVKHELDGFYIESMTGYTDTVVDGFADIDATIIPAASFQPDMVSESFTQALHFISDTEDGFQWIVGVFFMDDSSGYDPFTIQLGPNVTVLKTLVDTKAYSAFAEGTFNFNEKLSLTAGLRYSYEEKDFQSNVNGTDVYTDSDSWSDFSPRLVLNWDVNDSTNAYFSYSQAFKAGTYNTADAFSPAVNPEDLQAWETGIKWDASDRLRMNLAAFYYDHKDLQVTSRLEGAASTSLLLNAAEVESYGLEGELFYAPTDDLTIFAGYAFLKSEYVDFQDAVVSVPTGRGGNILSRGDVSGGTNIKSPEHSFFIGGAYEVEAFGGNLIFGGNIAWTDEWHFEPDARIVNPSHWNVNSTISWTPPSEKYELSLYGSNLLDEEYFTSFVSNPATDNVRYAAPRAFGAEIKFLFD